MCSTSSSTGSHNTIIRSISIVCIILLGQLCIPINGLKHHFHIKNAPSLLGPIGEPFGFTTGGIYEINLYNYYVYSKKKHGKDILSKKELQSIQYNGGFFLQKFNNDDEFYSYMDLLASNSSICSYEQVLNEILADNSGDDIFLINDDSIDEYEHYMDIQQAVQSATNGILLNAIDSGSSTGSSTGSTFYNNKDLHGIDHDHDSQHEPINTTIKYQFQSGEDGLYYLIYQVCPYNPNIVSAFHIDFHFLNFDALNNKSYLSAGEVHLPLMYLFFTISYTICFCLWVYNILEIIRGRLGIFVSKETLLLQQRRQLSSSTSTTTTAVLSRNDIPVVYTIHYLMTLLVLLKGLSIFLESVRYYKIQVTGHADFLSFVYYTISLIKGTFLFTVILLIGTGWSTVKSSLNVREKYIFTIVLLLQVLNNIAIVILSQETFGEIWYSRWSSIMHFIDLVCCCIIIIPIVWQVNELERSVGITDNDNNQDSNGSTNGISTRSSTTSAPTVVMAGEVGEKEEALHRLRQFRTFYIIVIVYLYSTRVFVYLFSSDLNYKHTWIQQLIIELITLLFYVTVGFIFKPIPESGYKKQSRHSDNSSDTTIQEEELELINRK